MQKNAQRRVVPLKCVDTGDTFPTIKDAADWLGITPQEMGQRLKKSDVVCQLRWEMIVVHRRERRDARTA